MNDLLRRRKRLVAAGQVLRGSLVRDFDAVRGRLTVIAQWARLTRRVLALARRLRGGRHPH